MLRTSATKDRHEYKLNCERKRACSQRDPKVGTGTVQRVIREMEAATRQPPEATVSLHRGGDGS